MNRFIATALCVALFGGSALAQEIPSSPIGKATIPNTQAQFNQYSADMSSVTRMDLDRAIAYVLMQSQTQFSAIQTAVDLAHQDAVRVPTIVDRAVTALQALEDGKIALSQATVDARLEQTSGQLAKLDIQFQERTAASSTAIAAALQAAKEAVGEQNKSSASAIDKAQAQTTEQLSQLRTLASAEISAQTAQITDLKSRLDKSEGPLSVSQSTVAALEAQVIDLKSRIDKSDGNRGGSDQTIVWIFGFIAAGSSIFAIMGFFRRAQVQHTYNSI